MNFLRTVALLACMPLATCLGQTQTVPPAPTQTAPAPSPLAEPITIPADQAWKLTDWPQLNRYKELDQTVGTDPGRVIFYGDSITDFWGRNGGSFFPGKPYLNRGISGQTTPQMVARFRQDVINLHPAAVVILAGTNDIAGNTGPETPEMIEDNFKSMVDLAKTNGIRVIIASILPVADYPWRPGYKPALKIQSLNNWLAGYCVTHSLTYLDYYTSMADENGGMKPGLSKDGVHPTEAGYAIMTPLALAAIDKAIGKR